MADVQSKLDELAQLIESARAMPLSASCVLNRAEVLGVIEELRALLPSELSQAKDLLKGKSQLVAEGEAEAERIVAEAKQERARLISRTEVAQEAAREAERLVTEATQTAEAMRVEVEDYVDAKLANFEVVLQKTIAAVERGRQKLRGRNELADLASGDDDELGAGEAP